MNPPRFRVPLPGYFGLFLTLFTFYMLAGSRERPWSDATPTFQVAQVIVERGDFDIPTAWPPTAPRGPDGKTYALAPLLQSLVHVPGAWLQSRANEIWPEHAALILPWAAHLAPSVLGALTCVLFLGLCRREGFSLFTALVLTGALGLSTTVMVYARYPYSEILQAFCLTGFFGSVLGYTRRTAWSGIVSVALWAGLLVNAKPVYAMTLPPLALYLAWRLRRDPRQLAAHAGLCVLAMLPLLGVILFYNQARFGSFLSTGYGIGAAVFSADPLMGLWGMFLSPGKSVFLYSPPLVLSLCGLWLYARDRNRLACLLLVAVPPIFLYARFIYWSGDWAWGPRYLVPFVPMFLLPAGYLLSWIGARTRRLSRWLASAAVGAVLLCGAGVQIVGSGLYWDHYIRLSTEAGSRWLGHPNPTGSPSFLPGNCGACFEDMQFLQWLPPFQPIVGQAWLLRHVWNKEAWAVAALDAPWKDYTNLDVYAEGTFNRARLDWWYRDWHENHREAGESLIRDMLLLIAFGLLILGLSLAWPRPWRRP